MRAAERRPHFYLPESGYRKQVSADESPKRDLRGFFRCGKGEKTQEYFVYFKFLSRSRGGKRPQSAAGAFRWRLPKLIS